MASSPLQLSLTPSEREALLELLEDAPLSSHPLQSVQRQLKVITLPPTEQDALLDLLDDAPLSSTALQSIRTQLRLPRMPPESSCIPEKSAPRQSTRKKSVFHRTARSGKPGGGDSIPPPSGTPCARRGIRFTAPRKQAAWRLLDTPATTENDATLRFVTLLGKDTSGSSAIACAEVIRSLASEPKSWEMSHQDSLATIVTRCEQLADRDRGFNFLLMVSYIRLVCKCQRYVFVLLRVP